MRCWHRAEVEIVAGPQLHEKAGSVRGSSSSRRASSRGSSSAPSSSRIGGTRTVRPRCLVVGPWSTMSARSSGSTTASKALSRSSAAAPLPARQKPAPHPDGPGPLRTLHGPHQAGVGRVAVEQDHPRVVIADDLGQLAGEIVVPAVGVGAEIGVEGQVLDREARVLDQAGALRQRHEHRLQLRRAALGDRQGAGDVAEPDPVGGEEQDRAQAARPALGRRRRRADDRPQPLDMAGRGEALGHDLPGRVALLLAPGRVVAQPVQDVHRLEPAPHRGRHRRTARGNAGGRTTGRPVAIASSRVRPNASTQRG